MRIGVTISRDWDDYDAVIYALYEACKGLSFYKATVVHGAYHMDWFVAGVAHTLGMETEPHAPNWALYGKGAGPIRNQEMVDSGADLWLSFCKNFSRGTTDCATRAKNAGIPVRGFVQ